MAGKTSIVVLLAAVAVTGCGSDNGAATSPEQHEEEIEGPAATEAAPEAKAPPKTGELPAGDRAAVAAVVRSYIAGLDSRDTGAVCRLFEPGALRLSELPV